MSLNHAGGRRRLALLALLASLALASGLGTVTAHAADGLQPPAAEALWPHWQARVTQQPGGVSALLGDYYFAQPSFGSFRASGGLLINTQGRASLAGSAMNQRWGYSGSGAGLQPPSALNENAGTATYLGVGYTGTTWGNGLSLTADVGLMSDRPAAALSAARALFGNSGSEYSLREMRLSPLLQVGLRYSF